MVTYFNTKDLVSFGNYMMSDERRARYDAVTDSMKEDDYEILPTEERLKNVSHADIANWKESIGKN